MTEQPMFSYDWHLGLLVAKLKLMWYDLFDAIDEKDADEVRFYLSEIAKAEKQVEQLKAQSN